MVERANSLPSRRYSRNTVPLAVTRTVEAGRRSSAAVQEPTRAGGPLLEDRRLAGLI